ncbi:hypothetical protein [Nostoc sp.]|uniref:hypothetical protein n=1 Tax=Nostoc sp. TaxID=1180 RepID=UPI002FFA8E21
MVRLQIGKHSISRRDLLYTFYGLMSFTALVSCGTNNGSTGNNSNTTLSANSSDAIAETVARFLGVVRARVWRDEFGVMWPSEKLAR